MKTHNEIEKILNAAPRLSDGPHRQRLKDELLREMRQNLSQPATPVPFTAWHITRLRLGCAAAVAIGAAAWGGQKIIHSFYHPIESGTYPVHLALPPGTQPSSSPEFSNPQLTTTGAGQGQVIISFDEDGAKPAAPEIQQPQGDKEIAAAIDAGRFHLVETQEDDMGFMSYLYDVTLADGKVVPHRSPMPLVKDAQLRDRLAAEVLKAAEELRGNVVKTISDSDGAPTYIHRITLSNGMLAGYASSEPDSETARRHHAEIDQAMAAHRGQLLRSTPGPGNTKLYHCRVTLSDGAVRTYSSVEPPVAGK